MSVEAAPLLERRGRCARPVMSNTEMAGQEAQQPPTATLSAQTAITLPHVS